MKHREARSARYGSARGRSDPWTEHKGAAEFLGVNLRTLYRFIDEGELPAYKFGRVIRLQQDDVEPSSSGRASQPGTLEHLYPEPVRADGA